MPETGFASNSKPGPIVKLKDNAEQLLSVNIDKEKSPEKTLGVGVMGGGAVGGVVAGVAVVAAAVVVPAAAAVVIPAAVAAVVLAAAAVVR